MGYSLCRLVRFDRWRTKGPLIFWCKW